MSFSYSDLDAKLPAGTLTQTADDVTISLKTLTGAASTQLTDTSIADAVHDLLYACSQAQADYNTATPSATINSFNAPTFSFITGSQNPMSSIVYVTDDNLSGVEVALDSTVLDKTLEVQSQTLDGSPDEKISTGISSVCFEPFVKNSRVF